MNAHAERARKERAQAEIGARLDAANAAEVTHWAAEREATVRERQRGEADCRRIAHTAGIAVVQAQQAVQYAEDAFAAAAVAAGVEKLESDPAVLDAWATIDAARRTLAAAQAVLDHARP